MRILESYVAGEWVTPAGSGTEVHDATTGESVAAVGSEGVDVAAALRHARQVGGPALRQLTFHQRAGMLKALGAHLGEHKEDLYSLSTHTGATRPDSWLDIEGGTGVLAVYASKGRKELPNAGFVLDGEPEVLAKDGSFLGAHLLVPREGVAVLIDAFNFPVWGMLEKLAPAILAGTPVLVKPATPTAYVAEAAFRMMVDSGVLPEGAIQLVCGSLGDAFDHLTGQDSVWFTGSASTAARLRAHPAVITNSVRFSAEADSLNASILGPSATPGTAEFDLYVKEVAREMTTKAGQRCTAIRRALVPAALVVERLVRVDPSPPPLAGLPVAEVVPQDLAVVEAQLRPRHLRFAEPARVLGVVGGLQLPAAHLAPVDGGDGVLPGIALRVRVGEELLDQIDVEARLLLRLADAGASDLFAVIDEAAGDRPAVGNVLAEDEDDPAVAALDDRVRGGKRVLVLGHGRSGRAHEG